MWRRTLDALVVAYLALLVAPLGPLLVDPDALLLAAGLLAGGTVGIVVVSRIDALARLDGLPILLLGLLVPLAWIAPAARVGTIPAFLFSPWTVGLGASVVWLVAAAIAQQLRIDARLAAASVDVAFAARLPPRQRRQLHAAVAAVLLTALVVGAVAVLFDPDSGVTSMGWWIPAMLPVLVVVLTNDDGREAAVTDAGLRVGGTLHAWDTFEGYDLTDDALTLRRTDWYRGTVAFDVADVDDPSAVTDALDRYL